MNGKRGSPAWSPRPEELAAFAGGPGKDGLDSLLRRRIADWLAAHPEVRAEVENQRRLFELFNTTAPPDPGEAAWSLVWDRIKERAPAPAKHRWGRQRVFSVALLLSTAAAVVLLVLSSGWVPGPPAFPGIEEEPFPVARADEVEILRVDGADTDALVVGELPLRGPVVLAGPGEVSLVKLEEGGNQARPGVQMVREDNPMFSAPLEADLSK